MKIALVMFKENGERKLFPIEPGKTVIGRKEDCGLRIPLGEISRRHALLMVEADAAVLRDLGSANGTYINNKRITEAELSPGDHIVIGPVVFTVQIDGQPPEVKPVHTRLEARKPEAGPGAKTTLTKEKETDELDDLFASDDEDPISDLEALAGSDDTSSLDLDDSFTAASGDPRS